MVFPTNSADHEISHKEGGPILSWWKAQQLLYDAVGDVLVVLDCCNAALVVEGEKDEGKFEILGASAKGIRTPEPGKSSFTTILIKHIKRSLNSGKDINVRGIHGELLRKSHLTGHCHLLRFCSLAEWYRRDSPIRRSSAKQSKKYSPSAIAASSTPGVYKEAIIFLDAKNFFGRRSKSP